MMFVGILALAGWVGCDGSKEPADDTDTVETDQGKDTWDSAEPPNDYTDLAGHAVLLHQKPTAMRPELNDAGYAIFVDDTQGVINAALCLLAPSGGPCVTTLGEPDGEAAVVSPDTLTPTTFNAGEEIHVGGFALNPVGTNTIVYVTADATWGGDGTLTFDGELAPYDGADDFEFPGDLEVTAPDPLARVGVGPGATVDFAWIPGGDGEVYLRYGTGMTHLIDDGAHALSIDTLGLQAPVDGRIVQLMRAVDTDIAAAGNEFHVTTAVEQWFYLDYTAPDGYIELLDGVHAAETCEAALALAPLPAGEYYGDATGAAPDYDLGDGNDATGYATAGEDEVVRVDLRVGQTLTVAMRQAWADGAVYLLDGDCDLADPIKGVDDTLDGEVETLTYRPLTDKTVLVVVDSWRPGGRAYALSVGIE